MVDTDIVWFSSGCHISIIKCINPKPVLIESFSVAAAKILCMEVKVPGSRIVLIVFSFQTVVVTRRSVHKQGNRHEGGHHEMVWIGSVCGK